MIRGTERGRAARDLALRRSLVAGAVYDLALGAFILLSGAGGLEAMGFAPPASPFLFRLAALPLFLLPALYLAAARTPDPRPFRMPVLWARGGGGAIVVALTAAHRPEAWPVYAAVGVVDLLWAGAHALLWKRSGVTV